MSKCAWIAGIALGISFSTSLIHAQVVVQSSPDTEPIPTPQQEESALTTGVNAAPEREFAPEFLPAIQGIEAAIRDLIAEEDAIESTRQEERELRDLSAQEEMARWAKGMFWATLATVGLTGIGVLLIWRTLIHTRTAAFAAKEAVDEARKATGAAIGATDAAFQAVDMAKVANTLTERTSAAAIEVATKANAIATDTAKKQLRAHLVYNGASVDLRKGHFSCQFWNYGATPAEDASVTVQVAVDQPHLKASQLVWSNPHTLPPVTLAPNQPMARGRQIGIERTTPLKKFRENGFWFYALIELSYRDIYGVYYKTAYFLCSETSQLVAQDKGGIAGVGVLSMREEKETE